MDIRQVTETIAMIEEQNFDIRTITMGISLLITFLYQDRETTNKVHSNLFRSLIKRFC